MKLQLNQNEIMEAIKSYVSANPNINMDVKEVSLRVDLSSCVDTMCVDTITAEVCFYEA